MVGHGTRAMNARTRFGEGGGTRVVIGVQCLFLAEIFSE